MSQQKDTKRKRVDPHDFGIVHGDSILDFHGLINRLPEFGKWSLEEEERAFQHYKRTYDEAKKHGCIENTRLLTDLASAGWPSRALVRLLRLRLKTETDLILTFRYLASQMNGSEWAKIYIDKSTVSIGVISAVARVVECCFAVPIESLNLIRYHVLLQEAIDEREFARPLRLMVPLLKPETIEAYTLLKQLVDDHKTGDFTIRGEKACDWDLLPELACLSVQYIEPDVDLELLNKLYSPVTGDDIPVFVDIDSPKNKKSKIT